MDVYCTRCGEPWDIFTVEQDEPESFGRCKGVITSCPCCQGKTGSAFQGGQGATGGNPGNLQAVWR